MEEISSQVEAYVTANNISGWASLGPVISALKNTPELRWAPPLDVKKGVEQVFLAKFGLKEATKPKGKVSKGDNDNLTSSYFIPGTEVYCQG